MKNEKAILRAEKLIIEAMEKYCEEFGEIPTAFWAQGVLNHLSTLNRMEIREEIAKDKNNKHV